jgi:hypothetical protein
MGSVGLALNDNEKRNQNIGLVAGGCAVIFVLGGIVLGMMFLPGYPLSKYKSFS